MESASFLRGCGKGTRAPRGGEDGRKGWWRGENEKGKKICTSPLPGPVRRAVKGEAIDGRDGAANVAWVKVHFMATKVCPCCDGAVLCLNGSVFSFPF